MTSYPDAPAPLVIERDPDEDDRIWLERHVNAFAAGMKAAHAAATEIAKNWSRGRAIGRLFPDYKDAASFLQDYIGPLRLPREERDDFIRALVASGSSRRSAAKAAGVNHQTANTTVAKTSHPKPEPSEAADWLALKDVIEALAAFSTNDVNRIAATVPERNRAATARRLRNLGMYLGRIAWLLEGEVR